MGAPSRIQRQRTKGWRMPENTVYVGRPTRWGNPYTLTMMRERIQWLRDGLGPDDDIDRLDPRQMAVDAFDSDLRHGPDSSWWWFGPHDQMIRISQGLAELRGKNLACWCPLGQPCHADVLLEIANQDAPRHPGHPTPTG